MHGLGLVVQGEALQAVAQKGHLVDGSFDDLVVQLVRSAWVGGEVRLVLILAALRPEDPTVLVWFLTRSDHYGAITDLEECSTVVIHNREKESTGEIPRSPSLSIRPERDFALEVLNRGLGELSGHITRSATRLEQLEDRVTGC